MQRKLTVLFVCVAGLYFKYKNSGRQRATIATSSAGMFCLSELSSLASWCALSTVDVSVSVRLETFWCLEAAGVATFSLCVCIGYVQSVNLQVISRR